METLHPERSRRRARTTRRPRTASVAAVLALAALALSACATSPEPTATTEAPPPSGTATPSPEPAPAPASGTVRPASRYDLTCDELVPPANISDMFDVAVAPVDPLVTAASAGLSVPRMTSALSIGGLACEWSNGEAYNSQLGTTTPYTGVLVTVVPPQDAGWSDRATGAGLPAPGTDCGADFCSITRVASGAWIAIAAIGGPNAILPVGADGVANAAVAAVDSASPPAAASEVPSGIPDDCEGLVPVATVESITGSAGLVAETTAGGWSEWAEAMAIAGDLGCRWMPSGADEVVVGAAWVRGGVWAFDRIEAAGALVPAPSDLAVAGADRAFVRWDPERGVCGVDLLVGPDWIQVTSAEQDWALAVAEEIAAGLPR
ncbi:MULTISPECIES: hypothetical protein [unclassified Agromyces]|uniref:hypothetical protein n=1 Tax=unclassified Agromyces TaxID=2639701 RepID=UPI003014C53F